MDSGYWLMGIDIVVALQCIGSLSVWPSRFDLFCKLYLYFWSNLFVLSPTRVKDVKTGQTVPICSNGFSVWRKLLKGHLKHTALSISHCLNQLICQPPFREEPKIQFLAPTGALYVMMPQYISRQRPTFSILTRSLAILSIYASKHSFSFWALSAGWMLINAGRCWMMLTDVDWCWLMLIDADLCWLILIDVDWCWCWCWCCDSLQ